MAELNRACFPSPRLRRLRSSVFTTNPLPLVLICASLFIYGCDRGEAAAEDPRDAEAVRLLQSYIRIDTSNPPGGETAAARWLAGRLEQHGLEPRLLGDDADRLSVYARLKGRSEGPALLLLHHLDVVPAAAEEWSVDPFGGEVKGGYVWGRGAIDVKSLGIAHLLAFEALAKRDRPPSRDVIFLGVADEESGGVHGVGFLMAKHPELFDGVGWVLNEGGVNEVIVDETRLWGVEIDQKVPLWVEITASGSGGHAAGRSGETSVTRLLAVLDRVQRIEPERRVVPSVQKYFQSLAQVRRGRIVEVMESIDRYVESPLLDSVLSPAYRSLLEDTWTITVLDAGSRVNVVPSTASAQIDIRLLPGSETEPVITRLRALAGDDAEVRVLLAGRPATASPVGTELWDVLEAATSRREPKSIMGPMVTAGATDSRFFRERGVVAYGFSPFRINYYDLATAHGRDEKIRRDWFVEGVHLMREIVTAFCE
jgi:acetylornithine deacetylase/succinyl-diaminopimelate desuccinylase-like protein